MAILAGDLAVIRFQEIGFYINFFIKLQRSQWAASPFTAYFFRLLGLRLHFFNLPD
jgi:hypothetical protein